MLLIGNSPRDVGKLLKFPDSFIRLMKTCKVFCYD